MNVKHILIGLAILSPLAWTVCPVAAQTNEDVAVATRPAFYSPYWWGPHHASTAIEGFLRGRADVIRARGESYYNATAGLINREQARSQYLENRLRATEVRYEKKRINKEYRDANRRSVMTAEQLVELAARRLPERLASYEYDRALGVLNWPAVLKHSRFDETRVRLDELFAQRKPDNSGVGTPNFDEIKKAIDLMDEQLRSIVGELDPGAYIMAKKFVIRIAFEARFPVPAGAGEVALR